MIFDSHFHIIDPRFPLVSHSSYSPPEFTCIDYFKRTQPLNIVGGAIISGSFQGFDQTYLIDALKTLGPTFVGVTQVPFSISDEEIFRLDAHGIRGVRFNLIRGGSEKIEHMEIFAKRIYAVAGWHIELYIDAMDLLSLSKTLLNLPAVSIDHLGLSKRGFPILLSLVEKGIKVKATGFGRVDFPVPDALRELSKANPDALMFGTDLPSTRANRPFSDEDVALILENFDSGLAKKILYSNAQNFYHPKVGPLLE